MGEVFSIQFTEHWILYTDSTNPFINSGGREPLPRNLDPDSKVKLRRIVYHEFK